MRHVLARALVIGCILALASSAEAQWTRVLYRTNAELTDFWFIDDQKGFFPADSNAVYLTNDAGDNWEMLIVRDCDTCIYTFRKIQFFGPLVGYLWGRERFGQTYVSFKTTDGGASWQRTERYIPPVSYLSETFGYTKGVTKDLGILTYSVKTTTDLGQTWNDVIRGGMTSTEDIFGGSLDVAFSSAASGIATLETYEGASIRKTHYRIDSVEAVPASIPYSVFVPLHDGSWMAADSNGIYRSTDIGVTWETIVDTNTRVYALFAVSSQLIFARQYPHLGISRSSDGGRSWLLDTAGLGNAAPIAMSAGSRTSQNGNVYLTASGGLYRSSWQTSSVKGSQTEPINVTVSFDKRTLDIAITSDARHTVEVYDLLGRSLLKASGAGRVSLDISSLPGGAYVVRAKNEATQHVTKFVK